MSATVDLRSTLIEEKEFERLEHQILHGNEDWMERLARIEYYHETRLRFHGARKVGRPEKNSEGKWSLRDTARKLRIGVGPLSEYLRLMKDYRKNPNVYEGCNLRAAIIKFRANDR